MFDESDGPRITQLAFDDETLAELTVPAGRMTITRGLGSGLTRARDGRIWAIGDRGPNLKLGVAVERYGLAALAHLGWPRGTKLMPLPAVGPAITELALVGDRVTVVETFVLRDAGGRAIGGLPPAAGQGGVTEIAIGLDGQEFAPDAAGADTEGIAVTPDGSFWIADEFAPSLLRVASEGVVLERWVAIGDEARFAGCGQPVRGVLPPIVTRRRYNRGFEALALTPDGSQLYVAFQSPLAHPDAAAHERARHVRILRLDTTTGAPTGQYLYPLDPPDAFLRDSATGGVEWSDLKLSELAHIAGDRFLVLERASQTTKLYAVTLSDAGLLAPEHLELASRPTLEELSTADRLAALPVLAKTLILDTDAHPQIDPDLEGMLILDARTLLLVNDSDFGVEGVRTRFWRVRLPVAIR